ncbi:unnamed protein product [Larinioides sclopetarius]|uniref:BTB domain-containing protein n=1 Tax=Larinioides sclopetarius TaxID=280406 RepID=A0AAV1ZXB9_9ARAC
MADKEEVELLKRLKSSNKSDVYNALVKIRKHYVRNYKKMKKLPQTSVIKLLISFIEDPRYCNLALSIIADACLEKNLVFEVIRQDGIQSLIRIMKSLVNDDIQNRACRALGNIAKSEVGLKQVVTLKPVSNILQFLMGTTDKNCQQTAVRTLRILARDSKSREIIVKENGIIYIAKLLNSSSKEVLLCSTKALAELSENCTIGCARQLLEMHSIKMLVELYSHSERDIRTHALTSLKNLSSQEEIRSDLIKVGAVKLFAEIAMSNKSFEMCRLATLALCSCLDHIHMWNNYGVSRHTGLKAILEVLRQRTFEDIHIHIITSLLPLCYECGGSETLFELEIIQILIQNLEHFINRHKTDHIVPVSDSDSLIKNETPPSLPPVELKCNSDDELSCNSYDTLSSKDYDIPLTETTFKRAKINREISCLDFDDFSPVNFSTSAPVKNVSKFYNSSYWNLHSSGASSYCSPSSSGSNTATSPNFYDFSVGSPVADPWSPQSDANETGLCWSPVLNCSDSSCDYLETEVEVSKKQTSLEIIKTESMKSQLQFDPISPSKKKLHSSNQSPKSASNKTDISEISINMTNSEKLKCDLETQSSDDKEYPAFKKHKSETDVVVTLDEKKTKNLVQNPKAMHKIDSSEISTNRYEKSAIDHHGLEIINTESTKSKLQFDPISPSKKKLHSSNQSPKSASNKTDISEISINMTNSEKLKCDLETQSSDDKEYPAFKKHKSETDVVVTLDEKKTKNLVQNPKAMHKIDSSEISTNRYEKSAIDHHGLEIINTESTKSKLQFDPISPSKKKLHSSNQSPKSASNKTDISEISINMTNSEKLKCDLETQSSDDKEYPAFKKHKSETDVVVTLDEKKTKNLVQNPKAMHKIDSSEISTCRYEKSAIDHHVLALLTQLSFHLEKKSNSAIAGRACFSVLMDYMYYIHNPNPKAEKFLLNLVKNRYSFEKLIMSGFVAEMEKRISVVHDPKVCVRCMQINNTYQKLLSAVRQEAESDYGVGTLCHILSTGEKPSQLYAIHAVSKLIVLRSALFRLIIQGNGLSLLLKFLSDESETTSTNAILYLCQLYQNLKKTSYGESFEKCCFSGTCNTKVVSKCAYKEASSDVTFCVGNINVSACRDTICCNSEYFNALLKGHFLESNRDSIKIDGISAETLTTIFHFLHGCKTESSCPYIKRIPFAIQLELLSECEKFLLFDVKAYIVDRLCHNLFPKTVPKIYEAAKIFNSPELQKKALHFVLSMNIDKRDALLNCFRELMSLEKDFNFFNDVKILIQSTFRNGVVNLQLENN